MLYYNLSNRLAKKMKRKIPNGGKKTSFIKNACPPLPPMPATPVQKWLQIGLETSVI